MSVGPGAPRWQLVAARPCHVRGRLLVRNDDRRFFSRVVGGAAARAFANPGSDYYDRRHAERLQLLAVIKELTAFFDESGAHGGPYDVWMIWAGRSVAARCGDRCRKKIQQRVLVIRREVAQRRRV